MNPLWMLCVVIGLGLQDSGEPAKKKAPSKLPPPIEGLSLEVKIKKTTVRAGEMILASSATLIHRGPETISLVMPGDGSDCDWRQPFVVWSVLDAGERSAKHPDRPQPSNLPRCGNVNSLRADEVFVLKKGAKKVLSDWLAPFRIDEPGRYRVRLVYLNEPERKALRSGLPLGEPTPEILAAFKATTPLRVMSNEIVITVTE